MMKSKNGAIELSVNLLVVIIISLVVLAGGIVLLYKFIGGAESIQTTLDARTEEELQQLLVQQGKRVVLPFHEATIPRGEQHVFGLGIMNIGVTENFLIMVNPAKYLPIQGEPQENPDIRSWILFNEESFSLGEQQQHAEGISISVPSGAVSGTYLFDVEVKKQNGERYGNIQKIIVVVE